MSSSLPSVKLEKVADLNPSLEAGLDDGEEVSFIPMSAVDADSATAENRETRSYSEVSKGYTPFLDKDVLVAKITPCFENGKIAQAHITHQYGFGSTEFHVVRARTDQVDPRYLVHFLRQDRIRQQGESRMTGSAGQRRVPEHFLAGLHIPLPPLPEQRRIAEILDKADALRAKRRVALAHLDALTQSVFVEMFGDPATNPKGWPRFQLGDLSDKARTWNPSSKPNDEFIYIDIAAIDQIRKRITGARRLIGSDAPSRARQQICAGDILVSTVRPNLNAVAIVDGHLDGATASTGFCVLRPRDNQINREYLFALVKSGAFISTMIRQASGASYPAVTDAIVRTWLAPYPPVELQHEFAKRTSGLARIKACGEASLDEFEELFASLQQRAFRGQL